MQLITNWNRLSEIPEPPPVFFGSDSETIKDGLDLLFRHRRHRSLPRRLTNINKISRTCRIRI